MKLKCKYWATWTENQSPLGSGEYWPMQMEDCDYPGELDIVDGDSCDGCPAYEPVPMVSCAIHGEEYSPIDDFCGACCYVGGGNQ